MYNKLMYILGTLQLTRAIGFLFLLFVILLLSLSSAVLQTQLTLVILCIAIYLWITEIVTFPVSGLIIISLITLLLGLIPDHNGITLGTQKSLSLALKGFSSCSMAMIMGALIIAASMQHTALDKLIATFIMSKMKPTPTFIFIGCLLVGICFAFLIPSPTGRTAVQIPILLGITKILDSNPQKKLTMLVLLGAIHISSIWNIGVLTATTHNVAGLELIANHFPAFKVNWLQWFVYSAPLSFVLSIILFFILKNELGNYYIENKNISDHINKISWSKNQKKLFCYLMILICLWVTEGILHNLSISASMVLVSSILLTPKIGVFATWKEAEKILPWGVLLMFGASLSLGMILVETGATNWLADKCFSFIPIEFISVFLLTSIAILFTVVLHLGFASATSLTFSLIPVYLAFSDQFIQYLGSNAAGFTLIQLFAISLGFVLPANAPQNMLGYATGLIDIKTFIRVGIKLTLASLLAFWLFANTWWQWLGLIGN